MNKDGTESLFDIIERERVVGMHTLADWWFVKFGNPRHDSGDRGLGGMFAELAMAHIASDFPVENTTEARDRFRAAFVVACQPTTPGEHGYVYWPNSIGTDYGPDDALRQAMAACGIDASRAPWKTTTHIYGGGLHVEVGDGYQRPLRSIYVAPVLDRLIEMSDHEIDKIVTDTEMNRRLDLNYAVSGAVTRYASIAMQSATGERHDLPFASEAISRLRETTKAK